MKTKGRITSFALAIMTAAIPLAAQAANGTVTSVVGGGGNSCSTTPTLGANVSINNVWSISSDGAGNMYYADRNNYVVCKIDPNGYVTRIAGTGTSGVGADNVQATTSALGDPIAITADTNGNVYISDYGSSSRSIRKVSTSGIITTIVNPTHVNSFTGNGGPASSATTGGAIALSISPIGELYFSDYSNYTIRKIDTSGNVQLVAGTAGTGGNTGDGGLATSARINSIYGIVFDTSGNIYLSSYANVIRKIDINTGIITRFAGSYNSNGDTGDGGSALAATFKYIAEIEIDAANNIFVAERGGSVVRMISGSTGLVSTVSGLDGTNAFVDGDLATARFGSLYGLGISSNGDIYVGDVSNQRIRKITGVANMTGNKPATLSLSVSATYRATSAIVASGGPSGKITFYANGKRIPGCISKSYSGSYTCSWKPTLHGANTVKATVVANDATVLTSVPVSVGASTRTTKR